METTGEAAVAGPQHLGRGPVREPGPARERGPVPERDLSVDLVRIGCLLAVVAVHVGMVGIGGADGAVAVTSPLTELSGFAVGTWFAQVMPLFFVLGGYGAHFSLSRAAERGTPDHEHLRSRVLRLGLPALPFFAVMAVLGGVLVLAGVPDEMAAPALDGAGDPLWFMAAFLICQGFAPAQHRLLARHGRRGLLLTTAALLAAVVAVDGLRHAAVAAGGTDLPGLLNMLTVWPLLQLWGMALARGLLTPRRAGTALWAGVTVVGFGATAALAQAPWYGPDMLANLNPPTLPLLTVGLMHLALFQLLRPALRRIARARAVQAVLLVVGRQAMHLYLWHLAVVIALNGALWLVGAGPEPGSALWWWTRLPVWAGVVLLTLALTWRAAGLERVSPRPADGLGVRVAAVAALVLAMLPNLAVTRLGLDLPLALLGTVCTGLAVLLAWVPPGARGRPRGQPRTG